MNLLTWNCQGALNPNFNNIVSEMVRSHSPAIMIITKTKARVERAKGITNKLPFDEAIFANTIGLSTGLWLL